MNLIDQSARRQAALKSLGMQRVRLFEGEEPDLDKYLAAIAILASTADDDERSALAAILPTKAKVELVHLDEATTLGSLMLAAVKVPTKATTKAWFIPDPEGSQTAAHERAKANMEWVIEQEHAVRVAEAVDRLEGTWVETWSDHGERRLARIARLAEGGTR